MKKIFSPRFLEDVSVRTMIIIGTIQLIIFVSFLQLNGNEIMPKPSGIAISTWNIITGEGFLDNFFSTLGLILKGMGISIAISLILVYISIIPAFSGITTFVSKLRFLTFTGLLFVFTILLKDGSNIKISLLLFGIIPYFVTSLVSYINDIPKKEYELCYSLKFNTW